MVADIQRVPATENVARLLSREWFVKDVLQHTAFRLAAGETYISVNRPVVDSYDADVFLFVSTHYSYIFGNDSKYYRRALMNVGQINGIDVRVGEKELSVEVQVEPRAARTKSHAGIFTRFQNHNIKRGAAVRLSTTEEVSADTILLEVREQLLMIAKVEELERK